VQPYPHRYDVQVTAAPAGEVTIHSDGLADLTSAPPAEFGGPGDRWSPETLLVAAAADCFILTFRAIAAASKLAWERLECNAEGVLDRTEGGARFTELHLRARLALGPGADAERARRLLEKAEKSCLITNSLALRPTLTVEIATALAS
jgi:peroxiredoxin-like protein